MATVCSMLCPLTIAGTEHLSAVLRLLCVYGLVKYKETMVRAITRAWGSSGAHGMYTHDLRILPISSPFENAYVTLRMSA